MKKKTQEKNKTISAALDQYKQTFKEKIYNLHGGAQHAKRPIDPLRSRTHS